MINEVGINDKCGGYLRLIPLVLLLVPPTLLLVPPGGTSVFQCLDQLADGNSSLTYAVKIPCISAFFTIKS